MTNPEFDEFKAMVKNMLDEGEIKYPVSVAKIVGAQWYAGNVIKYAQRIITRDSVNDIRKDAAKIAAYAFLLFTHAEDFSTIVLSKEGDKNND